MLAVSCTVPHRTALVEIRPSGRAPVIYASCHIWLNLGKDVLETWSDSEPSCKFARLSDDSKEAFLPHQARGAFELEIRPLALELRLPNSGVIA
jgi:hypothetical protein